MENTFNKKAAVYLANTTRDLVNEINRLGLQKENIVAITKDLQDKAYVLIYFK